jgi:hypothetical protein
MSGPVSLQPTFGPCLAASQVPRAVARWGLVPSASKDSWERLIAGAELGTFRACHRWVCGARRGWRNNQTKAAIPAKLMLRPRTTSGMATSSLCHGKGCRLGELLAGGWLKKLTPESDEPGMMSARGGAGSRHRHGVLPSALMDGIMWRYQYDLLHGAHRRPHDEVASATADLSGRQVGL